MLRTLIFQLLFKNAGRTFLDTNKDILTILCDAYRDDGSTALTAVLIGQRLYVANVGDSRAIAIKAGKGSIFVSYSLFVMNILPKSNVP
jgi:serine/threonine protein phosphatase PrpC